MEEAEIEATGFLTIAPPKLEDAGLEECALPPEAINLAFLKAANAMGYVLPGCLSHQQHGKCVDDPAPSDGELPDSLLCTPPSPEEERHRDSCQSKDGTPDPEAEMLGDKVVVGRGRDEGAPYLAVQQQDQADDEGERDAMPILAQSHV